MATRDGGERLAARLASARERQFVGRRAEQALFASIVGAEAPPLAVLWLHGPGGVGKSTLLRRFVRQAEEAGVQAVLLDARLVPASPAELSGALAAALGAASPAEIGDLLDDGNRRVLLIDTAERLAPLEGWLREAFLPSLPSSCLVVLAGREPPEPAWRADPGWGELLRVVSLRNLPPADSAELLDRRGVPGALHEGLIRAAHGHPLALALLADAAVAGGVADLEHAPDLLRALLERFAHGAPDDGHRLALHACAHARVVDEATLRALVDETRAAPLFDWLRSLCFVEQTAEGLCAHDLAGDVLDLDLRLRDPDGYRELHRRLRAHILRRLEGPPGETRGRAITDLVWLHRFNPVMGPVGDWSGSRGLYSAPLVPGDAAAILDAVARFEGAPAVPAVRRWLERRPEAFSVVRRGPGTAVGFLLQLLLTADECAELIREDGRDQAADGDSLLAAAWNHVRASSPPRGPERLALLRWMSFADYMQPGAMLSIVAGLQTALWLGTPALAWSFFAGRDAALTWDHLLQYLGHQRGPSVRLGEASFDLYMHDWRATPPAAWLDMMAERELEGYDGQRGAAERTRLVLSQEDFASAVRQALRDLGSEGALERNPLVRCRVVIDRPGGPRLRAAITDAIASLAADARAAKPHAALDRTYLHGTPTQELAAERLGLPFSTYRRHLTHGVDRVVEWLWERELQGWPS